MTDIINKLHGSNNLLKVLIECEDFLDNINLYVYDNWFDGVIVEGPVIERYWVSFTMKYPYHKMPDPDGARLIVKNGGLFEFEEALDQVPMTVTKPDDLEPNNKPKMKNEKIWLITITIPRKFINELDDDDLGLFDEEVDIEDVSDARDEDIDEVDFIEDEEEIEDF